MKYIYFIICFFGLISSSLATDGVVIISESVDLSNQRKTISTIYLTDTQLMIQNSGGDNSSMIFDASKEIFSFVDHGKREYYQFDKPTLNQLKQQLQMMVMMMKQFASQMPADQKEKLDKILNPSSGELVEYKKVGQSKVGSWSTDQYQGLNEGEQILLLDIANYISIGISESKFEAMKSLMGFFQENLSEVAAMLPTNKAISNFRLDKNSPVLKEGLPVKTTSFQDNSATTETLIKSIKESGIDDAKFRIPSGYSRKTINMQQQFQR